VVKAVSLRRATPEAVNNDDDDNDDKDDEDDDDDDDANAPIQHEVGGEGDAVNDATQESDALS